MIATIKNYHPHLGQKLLHQSTSKEVVVISSIRSGKSYSLIYQIIVDAWNNKYIEKGYGILVCSPTFRMLTSTLEAPCVELLHKLKLIRSHSYSKHETVLKNGSVIYYRSLEKDSADNNIRGLNIWKAIVDEATLCSSYSLDLVRGRLLLTNGQLILCGTPNGTSSDFYQRYFQNGEVDGVEYIKYSLDMNPEITEEAIERLKETYDELLFRQEVLAEWVNLHQNRVYYAFNEDNIKELNYSDDSTIYIGLDYNIGINGTVLIRKLGDGTLYVFDELYGYNTVDELAIKLKQYINGRDYLIIDDAASGIPRQQSTGTTNRAVLNSNGLYSIVDSTSNPGRLNRYALMNALFRNTKNEIRLHIHPRCENLIRDFNNVCYKKNSNELDSAGNKYGHISDACGYAVWHLTDGEINRIKKMDEFELLRQRMHKQSFF